MTKEIEDVFNLPRIDEALKKLEEEELDSEKELSKTPSKEEVETQIKLVNELEFKLKDVDNSLLDSDDSSIEEIREKALKTHESLLESGLSSPSGHAGNYLDASVQALQVAMNSETLKLKKKIESMRLKLDQQKNDLLRRKIELEERKQGISGDIIDDETVIADRNSLLDALLKKDK